MLQLTFFELYNWLASQIQLLGLVVYILSSWVFTGFLLLGVLGFSFFSYFINASPRNRSCLFMGIFLTYWNEYHQYDSFIYFQLRNKSQYSFIMISPKEVQTIGSILPSIVSHHYLAKSIIIICIATYGNAYMFCGDFGIYFQCILVKLITLPWLWVKLEHILTK